MRSMTEGPGAMNCRRRISSIKAAAIAGVRVVASATGSIQSSNSRRCGRSGVV
jgi:hypothetical protein